MLCTTTTTRGTGSPSQAQYDSLLRAMEDAPPAVL
jgi:hypothetical protein